MARAVRMSIDIILLYFKNIHHPLGYFCEYRYKIVNCSDVFYSDLDFLIRKIIPSTRSMIPPAMNV